MNYLNNILIKKKMIINFTKPLSYFLIINKTKKIKLNNLINKYITITLNYAYCLYCLLYKKKIKFLKMVIVKNVIL
ncbi:MAG: hypothetical protein NHF89_00600 [Candidatus Shikimatogenerans bostrichidophilus]|nr:MAG: hypothetical protein NHF89_00600 [Candidatus Shikimatogenerans bostrichidophilus]